MIIGFLLLGFVLARLQRAFTEAPTALEAYFWIYIAIWVLFVVLGSLSAVSQIFIFFCWPIYGYFALKLLLARRSHRPARSQARAASVRTTGGLRI